MIRTLTTEQLREIMCVYGNTHPCYLAAAECLANREAQPVAWRHDDGPFAGIAITRSKSVADSWIAKGWTVTPLFTAPPAPAPAVPEEMKRDPDADVFDPGFMNGWNACRAAMLAQPVSQRYKLNSPVIPDSWKLVPAEPTEEMLRAAYRESGVYSAKAYRAMLAAAPTQGKNNE